jgi:hypothetical protein
MYIAVKLYQSISNKPAGVPDAWPAETITLGESTTLPDGDGWILMTEEEFIAHKASNHSDYIAWLTSLPVPSAEEIEIKLATKKRQAGWDISNKLVDLMGARNKILGLTGAQISTMLQTLSPVKALLETGALSTARYYMGVLKTNYPDHVDIFDLGIDAINKFEQEFGM